MDSITMIELLKNAGLVINYIKKAYEHAKIVRDILSEIYGVDDVASLDDIEMP